MIFNKQFDQITFADVQEMVDKKYPENVILDYKREFNSNKDTAKVVSAFANTNGGFLIFGVEEEKDTNKPDFICGLDESEKQLESRLVDITVDNIDPYVACQYKVLHNDDKTKKVMVVKIPESDLSPHGVENNTICYIRVNDRKKPIERADMDKIEWLKEKRNKHVRFRDLQIEKLGAYVVDVPLCKNSKEYKLETLIIPQFPRERLIPINEFFKCVNSSTSQSRVKHNSEFNARNAIHLNDGLCVSEKGHSYGYYLECNSFGCFYVRAFISIYGEPIPQYIYLNNVCLHTLTGLTAGLEFLQSLNFMGSLMIRISISGIRESMIPSSLNGYGNFQFQIPFQCRLESGLSIQSFSKSHKHESHIRNQTIEFLARLLFLYGVKDDVNDCAEQLFESIIRDKSLGFFELYKREIETINPSRASVH